MIPADLKGNVIEGVRGLMHPDVLKYMANVEPRQGREYLLFTDLGRLSYTLSECNEK